MSMVTWGGLDIMSCFIHCSSSLYIASCFLVCICGTQAHMAMIGEPSCGMSVAAVM